MIYVHEARIHTRRWRHEDQAAPHFRPGAKVPLLEDAEASLMTGEPSKLSPVLKRLAQEGETRQRQKTCQVHDNRPCLGSWRIFKAFPAAYRS